VVVTTRRGVGAYRWELALVAVTAVWGSTFVLVRDAVAQIPPFTFIAYRFLAAALLLAAIRPRRAAAGQPGLLAAGAVLAAAGLALLSLQSLEVGQGDALVFGCAVAFAAHILLLGRYAPRYPSYPLAVVQLATIGLLALAWAGVAGDLVVPSTAEVWVALVITSVAASAGGVPDPDPGPARGVPDPHRRHPHHGAGVRRPVRVPARRRAPDRARLARRRPDPGRDAGRRAGRPATGRPGPARDRRRPAMIRP
jgi:uncharacterized membrane protein YhhN